MTEPRVDSSDASELSDGRLHLARQLRDIVDGDVDEPKKESEPIFEQPDTVVTKAELRIALIEMIKDDGASFSYKVQKALRNNKVPVRIGRGKTEEGYISPDVVSRWWKTKFGFGFEDKIARDKKLIEFISKSALERETTAEDNLRQRAKLQVEILKSAEENDINRFISEYTKKYPSEFEGIAAITSVREFIEFQDWFKKHVKTAGLEKAQECFVSFTEYQFLLNHFVLRYSEDTEILEQFWKAAESMFGTEDEKVRFIALKGAVLSQVAIHKIIQSLGGNPELAHPRDDAFNSIDLWSEDHSAAVQASGWNETVPAFYAADKVFLPASSIDTQDGINMYSISNGIEKNKKFMLKIKRYAHKNRVNINGYMMVVPYSQINQTNGDPTPELVEFFRDKISI